MRVGTRWWTVGVLDPDPPPPPPPVVHPQERHVAGDIDGMHPVLLERLSRMVAAGVNVWVNSGYRSSAEQKYLYDGWVARRPGFNPANPPGKSNHEAIPWGAAQAEAADLGGDLGAAHSRAGEFGLHFPIAKERWHVQPVENRGGSWPGHPTI